jgi:hypothetical protein
MLEYAQQPFSEGAILRGFHPTFTIALEAGQADVNPPGDMR